MEKASEGYCLYAVCVDYGCRDNIAANVQSWKFDAKTKSLNAETNRILKDVDRVILRSREMQKQYYEIDTTAIPVPVHRLY
jgi:hypothetical protein